MKHASGDKLALRYPVKSTRSPGALQNHLFAFSGMSVRRASQFPPLFRFCSGHKAKICFEPILFSQGAQCDNPNSRGGLQLDQQLVETHFCLIELVVRKSDPRNGLSVKNRSRLPIRMPSSKNRNGFAQNGYHIWIQRRKRSKLTIWMYFSESGRQKTDNRKFYSVFGCTGEL